MSLFLSTVTNKVDKKGRVSLPAAFRNVMTAAGDQGVILLRSPKHNCLEGFTPSFMEDLSARLDQFDLFSADQDDLATALFSEAVHLSIDETGRFVLTGLLLEHAQLDDTAVFVGLGRKFQIWTPSLFELRREKARHNVQDKGLTIPKQGSS